MHPISTLTVSSNSTYNGDTPVSAKIAARSRSSFGVLNWSADTFTATRAARSRP
jgi:hypothetical protein